MGEVVRYRYCSGMFFLCLLHLLFSSNWYVGLHAVCFLLSLLFIGSVWPCPDARLRVVLCNIQFCCLHLLQDQSRVIDSSWSYARRANVPHEFSSQTSVSLEDSVYRMGLCKQLRSMCAPS